MRMQNTFGMRHLQIIALIPAIFALLLSATTARAIDEGDQVEFQLNGKQIAGKVTEVLAGPGPARLMVDIGTPQRADLRMIPVKWVKKLNGKPVEPPPKVNTAVGGIVIGDRIEFGERDKPVTGVVTDVLPGGEMLRVNIGTPERADFRLVKAASAKAVDSKAEEPAPATDAAADAATAGGIAKGVWIEFDLQGKRTTGVVTRILAGGKSLYVNIGTPEREDVRMINIKGATALAGKPEEPAGPMDFNARLPDVPESLTLSLPPAEALSQGKQLTLRPMGPPADFPADPGDARLTTFEPSLIEIPRVDSRAEIAHPLIIDPAVPVIAYSVTSGQTRSPRTDIHVCIDGMPARRLRFTLEGHGVWLVSCDPGSGNVLGVVKQSGTGFTTGLCFIKGLATGSPEVAAHWKLPPAEQGIHVHQRRMASESLSVVTYHNMVRAFDVAAGRELWRAKAPPFFEPAISPGGKFVALRFADQYAIVETASGRQLGCIPADGAATSASIGFSPDGQMLAIVSGNRLQVYSLQGGRLLREHHSNKSLAPHGGPVVWPSKGFLITPAGLLIDLSKNLVVWKYGIDIDSFDKIDHPHAGLVPLASNEAIRFVRLPHREGLLAGNRDLSDLVAIKKGSEVQIVLEVAEALTVDRAQVVRNLEKMVMAAGYRVAPSANVKLVARLIRGKERTKTYQRFGEGGSVTVRYAPFGAGLELQKDGESLWEVQLSAGLPDILNGSAEAAARATENPGPSVFAHVKVPVEVLKKEYQEGFGSSGIRLEWLK